jgi:hypothetical protein
LFGNGTCMVGWPLPVPVPFIFAFPLVFNCPLMAAGTSALAGLGPFVAPAGPPAARVGTLFDAAGEGPVCPGIGACGGAADMPLGQSATESYVLSEPGVGIFDAVGRGREPATAQRRTCSKGRTAKRLCSFPAPDARSSERYTCRSRESQGRDCSYQGCYSLVRLRGMCMHGCRRETGTRKRQSKRLLMKGK